MKQIVCLSSTPWHGLPTRTMQILSRLKSSRILFFDQSPMLKKSANAASHKDEGEQVGKVTLHMAPKKSAMSDRFRSLNKAYYKKFARIIKKRMLQYAVDTPMLWLTDPLQVDIVKQIPNSGVIYDCQVYFSPETSDPKLTASMQELAKLSKVVIAQSAGIAEMISKWNENTLIVPNGVHFDLFSKSSDTSLPFPDDMFTIKNPILGHVGTLAHSDISLVYHVARSKPDWSFIFIGEVPEGIPSDIKNLHFLGVKPQKSLPMYLCRFDACLSLYKSSEMMRDFSPMKLFEYLATGKPIVSTPQPAQVLDFSDVVYIAGTNDEFLEACNRAVRERDAWKVKQRVVFARTASWDARANDIERYFLEKGISDKF